MKTINVWMIALALPLAAAAAARAASPPVAAAGAGAAQVVAAGIGAGAAQAAASGGAPAVAAGSLTPQEKAAEAAQKQADQSFASMDRGRDAARSFMEGWPKGPDPQNPTEQATAVWGLLGDLPARTLTTPEMGKPATVEGRAQRLQTLAGLDPPAASSPLAASEPSNAVPAAPAASPRVCASERLRRLSSLPPVQFPVPGRPAPRPAAPEPAAPGR